jgi:hypothetical protein
MEYTRPLFGPSPLSRGWRCRNRALAALLPIVANAETCWDGRPHSCEQNKAELLARLSVYITGHLLFVAVS